MDFSWSDEQLASRRAAVEFALGELNAGHRERERAGEFSRGNWEKCAEFGVQGLPMPEQFGGTGADILTTMLVMEGLGYGCRDLGLLFALNAQMWSVQMPILHFGSDTQKQRWLPDLCSGKVIGAHGMTEPDSGSDAFSLKTRAVRRDGGYVLNGSKIFVTGAPVCDMALVFATLDPSRGQWGISAFIVERNTPGFTLGGEMDKMGLRTAPMGELVLTDCYLPESCRLGPEGVGVSLFNSSMEWERSCILASHVGAMEYQLERAVQYAKDRRQFGQPIGKFQSVSNRIAGMKVRLETARLVLYKVAWLKKMNLPATVEAAIAKTYLSECFVQSSLDALAIYGAYGYMTESEVERDLRDAIGGTIYSGTTDIQKNIIARLVGL